MYLNRLEVIGHLGRDVDLSYTPSGKAVAKFSLAVNNRRGTSGVASSTERERKPEETLWLTAIAWERLADVCAQYLRKGAKVYAAGRLHVREFTRQDGSKGTAVELTMSDMQMLDSRVPTGAADDAHHVVSTGDESAADIPF